MRKTIPAQRTRLSNAHSVRPVLPPCRISGRRSNTRSRESPPAPDSARHTPHPEDRYEVPVALLAQWADMGSTGERPCVLHHKGGPVRLEYGCRGNSAWQDLAMAYWRILCEWSRGGCLSELTSIIEEVVYKTLSATTTHSLTWHRWMCNRFTHSFDSTWREIWPECNW